MKCYIHISLLQNTNLHQNIFIKQYSFNEMVIITAIVCNSNSAIKVQMYYKYINTVRSCTIYETESVSLSIWALKYFLCIQCACIFVYSLSLSLHLSGNMRKLWSLTVKKIFHNTTGI